MAHSLLFRVIITTLSLHLESKFIVLQITENPCKPFGVRLLIFQVVLSPATMCLQQFFGLENIYSRG